MAKVWTTNFTYHGVAERFVAKALSRSRCCIFSIVRLHLSWTGGYSGGFRTEGQAENVYSELSVVEPKRQLANIFDAVEGTKVRVVAVGDRDKNYRNRRNLRHKHIAAHKDPLQCYLAAMGMGFFLDFVFTNRKVFSVILLKILIIF